MAVTEVALRLHVPSSPCHRTFLSLHSRSPIYYLRWRPISVSDRRFLLLLRQWPLHIRRWDSNAESYSSKSNNSDEIEGFDDETEQWVEVLEDYIDSIWILKVFGSYGWMLPPILVSLLLVNGPKAFLLALALPIGQSTFAFAIERFEKRGKKKPKRKGKAKKRRSRDDDDEDGLEEDEEESPKFTTYSRVQGTRKKDKAGYKSWDDFTVSSNDNATNLGGWDELDPRMDYNNLGGGPSRRASQKSSRQKKHRRKWRESDAPLLLRLLVSIFPFLSSWTKIL